jgi:hypothetical protein
MSSKYWIEKAIKKPGSLKTQAERAGESTAEFASEHEDSPGKTGRRARLAELLLKMRKEKG